MIAGIKAASRMCAKAQLHFIHTHGLKAVAIQLLFYGTKKVLNSPWTSARGKGCHRLPRLKSRGNSKAFNKPST